MKLDRDVIGPQQRTEPPEHGDRAAIRVGGPGQKSDQLAQRVRCRVY